MSDFGYGDDGSEGTYQQGGFAGNHQGADGSWVENDIPYYIEYLKKLASEGYKLTDEQADMIAQPDEYFMSHGNPTKKDFMNQHPVLATGLIAAGMFGGPAVAGAMMGGGGGAAGGTLASTQIGSGMIGGISGGTGLAGGAGAATGAAALGGASIPTTIGIDAATQAGLPSASALSSSAIAPTASAGLPSSVPSGLMHGTGGSTIKSLLGSQELRDLGKGIGAAGNQMAQNRQVTGNFMQNYDRLNLEADQNRRDNNRQDLKQLSQTSYIMGGGRPYHASAASPYTYGFGPQAPSAATVAGATDLQSQILARMKADNALKPGSPQPTNPSSYTEPGAGETAANWAPVISTGLGLAGKYFGF